MCRKGSVYVFITYDNGVTWTHKAMLVASDGATNDWFGRSVAHYNDTIVVGANQDNSLQGITALYYAN